jgi:hypothetical protein
MKYWDRLILAKNVFEIPRSSVEKMIQVRTEVGIKLEELERSFKFYVEVEEPSKPQVEHGKFC